MPTDHGAKVINALHHLNANHHQARRLLGMYAGRDEMTAEDVARVLAEFPDRRKVNRPTR